MGRADSSRYIVEQVVGHDFLKDVRAIPTHLRQPSAMR